jgi:hypothetical protein
VAWRHKCLRRFIPAVSNLYIPNDRLAACFDIHLSHRDSLAALALASATLQQLNEVSDNRSALQAIPQV